MNNEQSQPPPHSNEEADQEGKSPNRRVAKELSNYYRLLNSLSHFPLDATSSAFEGIRKLSDIGAVHNDPLRAVNDLNHSLNFDLARFVSPYGYSEKFKKEVSDLRTQALEKAKELEGERKKGEENAQTIEQLKTLIEELRNKEEIGFLLTRVNGIAGERQAIRLLRRGHAGGHFRGDADIVVHAESGERAGDRVIGREFLADAGETVAVEIVHGE